VEQGGDQEELGVVWRDGLRKARLGSQLVQILDRGEEHAKGVFLARMNCAGVDQPHESELADAGEAAKAGRIDQSPRALRQRHIDSGRNANATRGSAAEFRDIVNAAHRSNLKRTDERARSLDCRLRTRGTQTNGVVPATCGQGPGWQASPR